MTITVAGTEYEVTQINPEPGIVKLRNGYEVHIDHFWNIDESYSLGITSTTFTRFVKINPSTKTILHQIIIPKLYRCDDPKVVDLLNNYDTFKQRAENVLNHYNEGTSEQLTER